jgi:hypothetical protein
MATIKFSEGGSLKEVIVLLSCPNCECSDPMEYHVSELIDLGYPRCIECDKLKTVVTEIVAVEGHVDP